jgi:glyoxylase-like metal-dependent hydrolase (beta-lactamase superfamily II)
MHGIPARIVKVESLTAEGETFATPEPRLHYLHEVAPEPGQMREIKHGLHWLRMPLPIDLNHINLWLIEDGDGCTLIDTGLPSPHCTAVWEQLEAGWLADRPLRRILLTHFHPDHMGCAAWLQSRGAAPIVQIAQRALPGARLMVNGPDAALRARTVEYFLAHGMNDAREYFAQLPVMRYETPINRMPQVELPLRDGDVLRCGEWSFEALEVDGHATGHLAYFAASAGILISGDQILPTISPNISLPVQDFGGDPLGDYLASLDRLELLPESTWVLPSHGRPFTGLRPRIRDLRAHHLEHLALLRDALGEPRSAFECLPVLFSMKRLRGFHMLLAMHECIAHLEHLVRRGEARRLEGAGGAVRYARC